MDSQHAPTTIRDADLLAELEASRGSPGFTYSEMALRLRQAERDKLALLPRDKRRRVKTRADLDLRSPSIDDLRHIHSVLAICGLPYKRLPIEVREFERRQGNMALDVSAGSLRNDKGENIPQPLPFGPKARLILMHLCSQAIYSKSPTIDLNETFTAFVRELGFNDSGGPRGALTAFKHQLNALAACTMKVSVWQPGVGVRSERITPIKTFDLWLSDNMHQKALWPSTLTFSLDFYESLKAHALPLNIRAIRAFAGSARTLDAYYWLGYRVTRLKEPLFISWDALAQQFGGGYTRQRDFRAHFAKDIGDIKDLFPKLPISLNQRGLTLQPASPEALELPVKAAKPKRLDSRNGTR